jgi:small acid-soluble spore protein P (minor)
MPKNKTQVVNPPSGQQNQEEHSTNMGPKPGSKRIKNENHSRHNNGEG